jgi:hypothetical protein
MKSVFLFISVFLIAGINSFGQNYDLVLTAKTNGFSQTILEGARIAVNCNDGRYLKGKLKIISNTQIILGTDKISIDEINSIRYGTKFSKITSGILIVGGGLLITACGISLAKAGARTNKTNYNALPVIGLIGVGAIVTTGGIIHLIKGRKFKKEIWEFSIKTK